MWEFELGIQVGITFNVAGPTDEPSFACDWRHAIINLWVVILFRRWGDMKSMKTWNENIINLFWNPSTMVSLCHPDVPIIWKCNPKSMYQWYLKVGFLKGSQYEIEERGGCLSVVLLVYNNKWDSKNWVAGLSWSVLCHVIMQVSPTHSMVVVPCSRAIL